MILFPQSGPDCFNNVLAKVETRLKEFYAKYDMSRGKRRFAVLVGGGSFNPLTRMHLRTYFLAKQCLEAKYGYVVLGSLLSPAHGATVRERYALLLKQFCVFVCVLYFAILGL